MLKRLALFFAILVIGALVVPFPTTTLAQVGGGATLTPTRGSRQLTSTPTKIPPSPTFTATATLDLPSPTPTSLSLRLPPPPEERPYRTPQKPLSYPPSPTAGLPLGADPDSVNLPDLIADEIEVTQGIQDLQNRMPLVSTRGTVVRVYMHTDGKNLNGVRGILEMTGKNKSTMFADNAPIVATASGGERINLQDSLYFYIPTQLASGKVKFRVFIYSGDPSTPFFYEKDAQNNFNEVTVEFKPGSGITVVMPSIHVHHSDANGIPENDAIGTLYQFDENAMHIGYDIMRLYPINDLTIVTGDNIYPPDPAHPSQYWQNDWYLVNHGSSSSEMLNIIEYERAMDSEYSKSYWYGMIDPTIEWWWDLYKDGEKSGTFTATGQSNGVVAVGQMLTIIDEQPWNIKGGITMAHEGGHNYGLGHYSCKGSEGSGGAIDPNYPYPYDKDKGLACSLAAVDPKGFYGFDWFYANWSHLSEPAVISNDPAAPAYNAGFPLMGYKHPRWADVYTYCKLLSALGIPCDLGDLGVTGMPDGRKVASPFFAPAGGELPAYLKQASEYLYVSGVIDNEKNAGNLMYSERYVTPTQNMLDAAAQRKAHIDDLLRQRIDTPYQLTLENLGGAILFSLPLYDLSNIHEVENPNFGFTELIPFTKSTSFIRIRSGNTVLAERRVSTTAPTVQLITPNQGGSLSAPLEIQWKGFDVNYDELTYNLQYSANGGETWLNIVAHITAQNVRLDSLAGLPGSDGHGQFRVIVMDGVNTGSDLSDVPFSMPDNPPSALILAPTSDRVSPLGGMVEFKGQGYDPEEKRLPDEAMRWSSDLDGEIGTGNDLHIRTLTAGMHTITLTVTDSKGQSGTATSYVYVDPNVTIPLPGAEEVTAANNIMNGIFPELTATPTASAAPATPTPTPAPTGPGGVPVIAISVIGVIVAAVIAFLFVRRRK